MNGKDIIQLREKFKKEGQTEGKNKIFDHNGNVTCEYVEWLETTILSGSLHPVIQRRFKMDDKEIFKMSEEIDYFVERYFRTRKAGTYSFELREYLAKTINKLIVDE